MSVGSPTVIPRSPLFPDLLPRPPEPHPLPLPRYGQPPRRFNQVRDLVREMDDLSSEEEELDEINSDIRNRGTAFLVPIGRLLTQQEEKNDADDASEDSDSGPSDRAPSEESDEEENDDSEQDLDADVDDMDDDTGNITGETEEGDSGDFEEEPSDV